MPLTFAQAVAEEFVEGAEEENIDVLDNVEGHEAAHGQQQRITTRYMTKYEKARVLGTRALQIRLVDCTRAARQQVLRM